MVELIPENQTYMPSQHNLISMFSSNTLFALPNLGFGVLIAIHIYFFTKRGKKEGSKESIYDVMSERFIDALVQEDSYYQKEQHMTIIKQRPEETLFKLTHYQRNKQKSDLADLSLWSYDLLFNPVYQQVLNYVPVSERNENWEDFENSDMKWLVIDGAFVVQNVRHTSLTDEIKG